MTEREGAEPPPPTDAAFVALLAAVRSAAAAWAADAKQQQHQHQQHQQHQQLSVCAVCEAGAAAAVVRAAAEAAEDVGVGLGEALLVGASWKHGSGEPPPWLRAVHPRARPWRATMNKESHVRSLRRRLLARGGVLLVAYRPAGTAALRVAQLWTTTPADAVHTLVLAPGALPDRKHATSKVLYIPCGPAPALAAREIWSAAKGSADAGGAQRAWVQGLRRCLRAPDEAEGALIVLRRQYADDGPAPPPVPPPQAKLPPVMLSVAEQLDAASATIRDAVGAAPLRLADGVCVALLPSSAERFCAGGYADAHYVRENPNEHGVYFELAHCSESSGGADSVRFAYAAVSVYDPTDAVQRPFAPPGRALCVAQVDRLAVLPSMRRRGAATALLRRLGEVCAALGYPLRVRTASEQARAAFERCACLTYEGHIAKASQRGVNKRRVRKVYANLPAEGEGKAAGEGSGGAAPYAPTVAANESDSDPETLELGAGDAAVERLLRAVTSALNRASPEHAARTARRLRRAGRAAEAIGGGSLRAVCDCIAQAAARGGADIARLYGRAAAQMAAAVHSPRELQAAAEETVVAARATLRQGGGALYAQAADRLAAAASFAAAAAASAEDAAERALLLADVLCACEGMLESACTGDAQASAEAEAACAALGELGRARACDEGDDTARLFESLVTRASTLEAAAHDLAPRAAHRCAELGAARARGWAGGAPRVFERSTAEVRREAATSLGVELSPGRGEREGFVYYFSGAHIVNPHTGRLYAFVGGKSHFREVETAGEMVTGADALGFQGLARDGHV